MSDATDDDAASPAERTPGRLPDGNGRFRSGLRTYLVGLLLASGLSVASFAAAGGDLIYGPAVPFALAALAIAQMGVHLVFFLHITTDPDNTNNALALAFGVLIVFLVIAGSLWVMSHLNNAMMPMDELMRMQR